jgi:signal transduction histidine kinase
MLAQSRNAAMGEMISMIAHQWRQPITTISMDANNIIADIELNEFDENVIKDIAHNIGEQTQFLSKTIDDFRNFFKEDKEVEEFKVSDLINELDTILLASIKNNNITYKVEYEQNLSMKTHKRELLQVLLNLVKNAKEALIENKNNDKIIKLFFKEEDENIQIIVQDNAGGIKEENLDKIFKAYFTTKKEMNGTGLGLYMSKMIIEKNLKGTIVVTNEKDGAQFIITIKKNLIL